MSHYSKEERLRRKELGRQRAEVAHIIRYEMKKRGYNIVSLGRKIGRHFNAVAFTINGKFHSECVLDGLISIGIDPSLLYDPRCTVNN